MKYLLYIVIFIVVINVYKLLTGGILASRFPVTKLPNREESNYYYNPITRVVYYIPMGNWFELA